MLSKQMGKSNSKRDQGRPQDQEMLQSFEQLCQWLQLEGGTELYTLSELHEKLEELASSSEVYTIKRLKQKLMDYYKDFTVYFLLRLKDVTMLFVLETWPSLLSMKNGTWRGKIL